MSVQGKLEVTSTAGAEVRTVLDGDRADVIAGDDGRGGDLVLRDDQERVVIRLNAGGEEATQFAPLGGSAPPGAVVEITAGSGLVKGHKWMTDEYRKARDELLQREIELRREMEAVAQARRALAPGGAVPQDYIFEGLDDAGRRPRSSCRSCSSPARTRWRSTTTCSLATQATSGQALKTVRARSCPSPRVPAPRAPR